MSVCYYCDSLWIICSLWAESFACCRLFVNQRCHLVSVCCSELINTPLCPECDWLRSDSFSCQENVKHWLLQILHLCCQGDALLLQLLIVQPNIPGCCHHGLPVHVENKTKTWAHHPYLATCTIVEDAAQKCWADGYTDMRLISILSSQS